MDPLTIAAMLLVIALNNGIEENKAKISFQEEQIIYLESEVEANQQLLHDLNMAMGAEVQALIQQDMAHAGSISAVGAESNLSDQMLIDRIDRLKEKVDFLDNKIIELYD